MSAELQATRDAALAEARAGGVPVVVGLTAKGVDFGALTARPDGSLDTRAVAGVDPDLVVKPFGWKGVFPTIRGFAQASLHLHLGLQAEELLASPGDVDVGDGPPTDRDGDGVAREITAGQLTALVLFLATLDAPTVAVPLEGAAHGPPLSGEVQVIDAPELTDRWLEGAQVFATLGCPHCHVPFLPLEDARFTTAPPGGRPVTLDLEVAAAAPRPVRGTDGVLLVPVFSDLKRHGMGRLLASLHGEAGVPVDAWITRRLAGVATTSPYLHDGAATDFDEAISLHGGEAAFAADAFAALPEHDRASLRVFLLGLQRAPAFRVR
ncbi:MAG: di-heme oxidoredictase family protein [bacterium]